MEETDLNVFCRFFSCKMIFIILIVGTIKNGYIIDYYYAPVLPE